MSGVAGLSASLTTISRFLPSLTGVTGSDGTFSSMASSCSVGDEGRVTAGVESAVPRLVLIFLAFFLRPMIGACTGSSTIDLTDSSSAFDFSASFARACLSRFCWALLVCRTGAVPTLEGGGELARDIEVDVKEALSEILSLIGVPGPWTDVKLGRREHGLLEIVATDSGTVGDATAVFTA